MLRQLCGPGCLHRGQPATLLQRGICASYTAYCGHCNLKGYIELDQKVGNKLVLTLLETERDLVTFICSKSSNPCYLLFWKCVGVTMLPKQETPSPIYACTSLTLLPVLSPASMSPPTPCSWYLPHLPWLFMQTVISLQRFLVTLDHVPILPSLITGMHLVAVRWRNQDYTTLLLT